MQGRENNRDIDDFLEDLDSINSLQVIQVLKDSEFEKTSLACDSSGKRYVLKEIKNAGDKPHPYEILADHTCKFLPKIYRAFRAGTELFVVMEALAGPTLSEQVRKMGPMGPKEALDSLSGVIRGIDYLHNCYETPLIHRDIKPDNIILTSDGARLIDFGIMRSWEEQGNADTACMGTRGYAAPEQFGFAQTDERTDIYALGCTFRFALTGHRCSKDTTDDIAQPVQRVLDKATAFDPSARYVWVGDFYADLKIAVMQCTSGEDKQQDHRTTEEPESKRRGEEAEHASVQDEKAQSTEAVDDDRQSFRKPGKRWRTVQLTALFFSLVSIVAGVDLATGKSPSNNPLTSTVVGFFMFAIPLLIVSDPFDFLRKRGFFDVGTGKRFAQCVGVGVALSFLAAAIASILADLMPLLT